MRLTIHTPPQIPEQHKAHVDLILHSTPGFQLPGQACFYLATFNDKAVALAWRQDDRLAYIAVRDVTRRRGIGRELLRHIKEDAKHAGLTRLQIDTSQANAENLPALMAFLQEQGFTGTGQLLSYSVY
ncbi:GNAT family N-acetyltransferase [Zobellella maritima]|uniref:GNAT family N-acetyltransferase n=1 Tax=Zobellella maritima TaxID=2059725 RepID=UPI000E3003CF|nr:acetyl-CoA sensor PanZ family protein [Zobellella maritima]